MLYRLHASGRMPELRMSFPVLAGLLILVFLSPRSWPGAYDLFCLFLVFPIVLLAGAQARPEGSSAICRIGGDLSYPLYIIHAPIYWLLSSGRTGPPSAATCVVVVLVAVLASGLALQLYDEPVRRVLSTALARSSWPKGTARVQKRSVTMQRAQRL